MVYVKNQAYAFFILVSVLTTASDTAAQLVPSPATGEQEERTHEWPDDSLGRRSPRGTTNGFIDAVTDQNYSRAARYINFNTPYPPAEKERIVRTLQRLLDEAGNIVPYSWISEEATGREGDDLPPGVDRIGTLEINGETITLTVEETKGPDGAPLWLISSDTMAKIVAVREMTTVVLIDQLLPEWSKKHEWGGVAVGQWLAILLLAIIAYLMARAVTALTFFLLPKVWPKAAQERNARIIRAFGLPVRICLALILFMTAAQEFGISILLRQRLSNLTSVIGIAALLLLFWRLADVLTGLTVRRFRARRRSSALSAVLFFRRLAKIVIIAVGLIMILAAFGVDVTTGLAALGIGGLALALGAQKSIENFVGSVMLITDQPIRVGDFCKAGDVTGTVEAIGMRSTRIRTVDQTVVTIPNGELSSDTIENFAHRRKFKFQGVLGLRRETNPDQVRHVLSELRSLLRGYPKVDPNPARIRFIEVGTSALNLEIFAYIDTPDFEEFMEIREDLLLRMMDVVKDSGSALAFPSQTLYLSEDGGLPEEKHKDAEAKEKRPKNEDTAEADKTEISSGR